MRARRVALLAAIAGAVAGLVWWRRRAAEPPVPGVQIGLTDGSVRTLDRGDPSRAGLEALAAGVRDSLTGGT